MKPTKDKLSSRFTVRDRGTFLFTRDDGASTRTALETHVRACGSASLLIIDFTGVTAMTNSFTDEFLGKFYLSLAAGDSGVAGVHLVGLDEETRDAVAVCLERRKQIAVDGDKGLLLGDVTLLADTYEHARQLRSFRATSLAEAMGVSPSNANNRLKRLVEAGALKRERTTGPDGGGKEFVYTLPGASRDE
ncbi:MarR family transcriptional regulator [Streptomyces paludis]|uniref:MarR family transcriptional regulator n=1 Tax=Streptomyces paludis TaxID=2282738 RepID=A0A345HRA0_9ACTN|nr:MarR family transcriptional regulator [Streptomyces paludis]AXG79224.1 MarR family transcriptional regulator [Streptomyces paludis]